METGKTPTVVGLGEILWDVLPGGKRLGGAPANFAYHVRMLGLDSFIVSSVGEDEPGREMIDRLVRYKIPVDYIHVSSQYPTSTVDVKLQAGKPTYTIHENVAWDHLPFPAKVAELARQADAVCFGSLCQRNADSRETIHAFLAQMKADALKVYDVNLRQHYFTVDIIRRSLNTANVLKLNEEELPVLAELLDLGRDQESQLQQLIATFDLRLIALTLGPSGSLLVSAAEKSRHAGLEGPVEDTVGAGDSFTAALVAGLLKNRSLQEINQAANRLATFVASQAGATPEVPESLARSLY